jgi:hypothetical protein
VDLLSPAAQPIGHLSNVYNGAAVVSEASWAASAAGNGPTQEQLHGLDTATGSIKCFLLIVVLL